MIGSFFSNTLQSKPKLIEFFLESLSASASAPSLPFRPTPTDVPVVDTVVPQSVAMPTRCSLP